MKCAPWLRFAAVGAIASIALAQSSTHVGARTKSAGAAARGVRNGTLVHTHASTQASVGADDCALAEVISGTGTFTFDNTLATTGSEGQAESICSFFGVGTAILNDVWFVWTAPTSGMARWATCAATTVDTKLAVYDGAGCPTTPAIGCNDDGCNGTFQSSVTWNAIAGSTYTLQLGLYPGATPPAVPGTGMFELSVLTPPTNDDCAAPTPVVGNGPHAFDNMLATTGTEGQQEALCSDFGSLGVSNDVWFTWTATFSGRALVDTCTSTLDTKIAVYDGAGCPLTPAIGCNDDACDLQSRTQFQAVLGQSYTIQLGLFPGTLAGGTGVFEFSEANPPPHDECTTPQTISGPGPFSFDTEWATTGTHGQSESACLFFGSTTIDNDLWFAWTPDESGTATLSLCGQLPTGSSDTKVAVYAASACPTSAALACNDDFCGLTSELSFAVQCTQTYLVQLGRFPGGVQTLGTFTIVTSSGTSCSAQSEPFCFGTSSACPCGNGGAPGNGCAHSLNADGANLSISGTASIAADTLALLGSGMPNSSALYFQGTLQAGGGKGVVFGDGLRCASGTVLRLGTTANTGGASQYPFGGAPPVSVRGQVTEPGVRTYQIWYRNSASFCTPDGYNLSNGFSINWSP
jgi:hypothetical protein